MMQKMKGEMDEKDRKIKELNIRLETLRKSGVNNNRSSREFENLLN